VLGPSRITGAILPLYGSKITLMEGSAWESWHETCLKHNPTSYVQVDSPRLSYKGSEGFRPKLEDVARKLGCRPKLTSLGAPGRTWREQLSSKAVPVAPAGTDISKSAPGDAKTKFGGRGPEQNAHRTDDHLCGPCSETPNPWEPPQHPHRRAAMCKLLSA
jgi:hypothetical protein